MNPGYWNLGFTTEALKEVIKFVFEKTEMDRLNGRADIRNIASNRVMEKCGFLKEGTIRKGKMVKDNLPNEFIWFRTSLITR